MTERTVAIVDLEALETNVRAIRAKLPEGKLLTAVVKANAYGHGAAACYPTLKKAGVDRYAVAMWQEGMSLRQSGVTEPILILGDTPDHEMEKLLDFDLIPAIFSMHMAQTLETVAASMNRCCRIHIKLDTGMGRIGFPCNEETVQNILKIAAMPHLEVEGMFSHFARADEYDKTSAQKQYDRYAWVAQRLHAEGLEIPVRHIDNSAAIMELQHAETTMARAGIILYGLYPSNEVDPDQLSLKRVMSWKAGISFVKKVEAGTPISYGGTFVTKRPSVIATVPVGYADGFNRLLSNRWEVVVRGQKAPICGRVCMDQFMIDVTDIPGVERGDEVVLMGPENTADDMAQLCGTINYEIVCDVSQRVPRVYRDGAQPTHWTTN